ncbi:MAG: tRNA dihydrouridine(20/20a) synthase DusA [Burkholderiales bacterium]|nr:tRNA dihydrouridine(20/20a) synthase DusA [Burkholderiales bacterium]
MDLIAVAPMLDWSDRHYRFFMRQITQATTLYTEMVVADAIIHGNQQKLLEFNSAEQPVIVQLGGSDPKKLQQASKVCQEYNYAGINLNVGCPSDRVKSGNFGACLMQDANLVADCYSAMQEVVTVPVSIKHRIGLNYNNDYGFLRDFVGSIAAQGCTKFIVHARNAVLTGLSPKQNREIPPLNYEYVYNLKRDFPGCEIVINGGVKTIVDIDSHLKQVDGVMLGREAYYNPYLFSNFDQLYFKHQAKAISRKQVAEQMLPYLYQAQKQNIKLHHITRHMIGLFHGCRQAKIWRYQLTNGIIKTNAIETYTELLNIMDEC